MYGPIISIFSLAYQNCEKQDNIIISLKQIIAVTLHVHAQDSLFTYVGKQRVYYALLLIPRFRKTT